MKTAILTGANGQLGGEFLATLRGQGYLVYAVDKNISRIGNDELVKPIQLDITNEPDVNKLFSNLKYLDILINNAGIGVYTPFEERTVDEFRMVMDVNLLGPFLMAKNAIKIMKKQAYGKIVNIGSIYGIKSSDERIYGDSGRNNSEVYSATKAGIIQMTKYLATHFGKYNIQTNCISPGGIYNDQNPEFVENYEFRTPAGRMGNPKDISNVLKFLIDNNSEYINGHNIVVDGGFSAW
ncbi:SDR family oxidoreductase [bacterium]|nr:SDR family oxidoreductase [bacterium]